MVVRFPQKRAPFSSSSRKSSGETDFSSSSVEADPIRVIAGLKQCGQFGAVDKTPLIDEQRAGTGNKKRPVASSHGFYHPYEVHYGCREEAVVFRCL